MATGDAPLPDTFASLVASLGAPVVVVLGDGGQVAVSGHDPAVAVETGAHGDGDPLFVPDAFTELNEAFATAVTIRIPRGGRPAGPVVVVHWAGPDAGQTATFPRLRVEVGAAAEAGVVELAGSDDVAALSVPVTEIDVADGANVQHLHVQQHAASVWQIGRQASRVARDATFTSAVVALGGDYARMRTESALTGAGATTRLLAAYFGTGSRTVDLRTAQDHRAPRTTSDLLFKGAVANRSRAVYTGLIRVEKGARGTNAFQTNRNLVLHEGARADSVPNLEIEDNDVRCSHASAVGPISAEQRFYLESRGVRPETADRLITLGFLDEVLARMPFAAVVDHVRLRLVADLDGAEELERVRNG